MSRFASTVLLAASLALPLGCSAPPRRARSPASAPTSEAPAAAAEDGAPSGPEAKPEPAPVPEPEPEPEPAGIDVVVSAGEHDRANTPVSIPVQLPEALAERRAVKIVAKDGSVMTGQIAWPALLSGPADPAEGEVAREVWFVLPKLAAGKELELRVELEGDAPEAPAAFKWQEEPGKHFELRLGERPVLRYMCETLDPERRDLRAQVLPAG